MTFAPFDWIHTLLGSEVGWKDALLPAMAPIFLVSFLAEWLYRGKLRGHAADFRGKDILANLSLGLSYLVVEALMKSLLLTAVTMWVYQHRVADVELSLWTALPFFLAVELCYYGFHRTAHRVRWFWTAHVPHHSGEHMNFTTAMRQSMLNSVVGNFLFFLPLVYLGCRPGAVGLMMAINLIFQFYIHTNLVGKLPPWVEFIFNTPSHHRVHHGKNPQYIDKNFGGMLIVFDRLFGTFEPEVEQPVYGVVRAIHSYNPLILNLHEMVDMLKDVLRPGPLGQRLKHLWAPPEWERPATPKQPRGD